MSEDGIVRRPVRLYLTVNETERLAILAAHMRLTKGQTIRAAIEKLYRDEIGASDELSPRGPRGLLDERV